MNSCERGGSPRGGQSCSRGGREGRVDACRRGPREGRVDARRRTREGRSPLTATGMRGGGRGGQRGWIKSQPPHPHPLSLSPVT